MKTVEVSKATLSLADYAKEVDREPVIVTHGTVVTETTGAIPFVPITTLRVILETGKIA